MNEIKGRRINIQSGPGSFGAVDLDGLDISSAVRGATLRVEAGKVASVTLDLRILDQATAEATDVAVRIPEMTRQALIDLGWTPPGPLPLAVAATDDAIAAGASAPWEPGEREETDYQRANVESYLGLGDLIARLEREDPTRVVPLGFTNPHSYRGDYMDLAFEPVLNISIGDMLAAARSALGATYQGWKGGDYTMGEHTSCWIAEQGDSGDNQLGPLLLELLLANDRIPGPA